TTIKDNDVSVASVALVSNGSEGSPAATSGTFKITLSNASSTSTDVSFSLTGTATEGDDYTAISHTVTFAAGETEKIITIPVLNDAIIEGTETVIATLTGTTNPKITV
ncbi:hypothetical protein GS399_20610, partial [Pedobacter sp. HMF7647]